MDKHLFKKVRLYLEMDQQKFGELLGVTSSYISTIENGHKPVSDALRMAIAKKVQFDDMFIKANSNFLFLQSGKNA